MRTATQLLLWIFCPCFMLLIELEKEIKDLVFLLVVPVAVAQITYWFYATHLIFGGF
jgi:hypothetical protein